MFDGLLSPIHCITTQAPRCYGGKSDYKPHGKRVYKYALSGDLVSTYETQSLASREVGMSVQRMRGRLQRGDDVIGGYRWEFEGLAG